MDLSRLQIFNTVAQLKNISRASEKLGLSQSTVSRSIMELEQSFGSKLVNRTSRGVTLTAQGGRVFDFTTKILQKANLFEKLFHEEEEVEGEEIQGEIKIATMPYFGANWLIPKLEGFLEAHDKVTVNIALTDEELGLSDSDVVIRPFMQNNPDVIQVYVETVKLKLFASKKYLDKYGIPKTPQDLDNHRLISFQEDMGAYGNDTWHLRIGREDGQPLRQPYCKISSIEGTLQSAVRGFGIATLHIYSRFPQNSYLLSSLVEVLPDVYGQEIPVYYIFPKERLGSKKITLLAEYLEK